MRISDWSSDVCSSDLPRAELIAVAMTSLISRRPLDGFVAGRGLALLRVSAADKILNRAQIGEGWILDFPLNKLREPMRSDERRLGQEGVSTCRSGWRPCH